MRTEVGMDDVRAHDSRFISETRLMTSLFLEVVAGDWSVVAGGTLSPAGSVLTFPALSISVYF